MTEAQVYIDCVCDAGALRPRMSLCFVSCSSFVRGVKVVVGVRVDKIVIGFRVDKAMVDARVDKVVVDPVQ